MVTGVDIAFIVGYLVVMLIATTILSIGQGLDGFLVNNRKTKLTLLVLSIVSTNIGAGFFLAVGAEAYSTGISFGLVIILISIAISLVIAYFAPKIKNLADAGNIYTLPEFLANTYNSRHVLFVSGAIILIGYLFVTALQFVGVAALSSVITDLDFHLILIIAGLVTITYTAIGGIRSDIYADMVSFLITLLALILIFPFILKSGRINIAELPARYFDPFAFGGPAFFLLSIVFSVIGAFFFMELWQRIFAAESAKTARKAFIISAFVQVPFIAIGLFLGLVAALLFPNVDKSVAIFAVMVEFLPKGFLGLGLVAILAILMDTINSLVVVGGSTLVNDFYRPFHIQKSETSLLRLARAFTVIFGFASLGMAVLIPDIVRLLLIGAFLMMPMGPAIIGALLWKRASAKAASLSMVIGFTATILLIPKMPETAFVPGFFISLIVFVAVSLLSKSPITNRKKGGG